MATRKGGRDFDVHARVRVPEGRYAMKIDDLEALFARNPAAVVSRLLRQGSLERVAHDFLLEHVGVLTVQDLATILAMPSAQDLAARSDERFVEVLAGLLPEVEWTAPLAVLSVVQKIDPESWFSLTKHLRGRLPEEYVWWRFVDYVKGGPVFNAINVPDLPAPLPTPPLPLYYLAKDEPLRPEPVAVQLLDHRWDDATCARVALTLPMHRLLKIHASVPEHVTQSDVEAGARGRVASDDWWWPRPTPENAPFPDWFSTFALERARYCPTKEEALVMLQWLRARGAVDDDTLFDVALDRCRKDPFWDWWHHWLGSYLSTASRWKHRGRGVVDLYLALNSGFPAELLRVARRKVGAEDERRHLFGGAHDCLASALVARAEQELREGDPRGGRNYLAALVSLDPGSFISGPLHGLRSLPNVPADVVSLIDQDIRLFKKSGSRSPAGDGFLEAFEVLREVAGT